MKNGTLDELTYTLKYDNASVTLSTTAQNAKSVTAAGVHNDSSEVSISYTGKNAEDMVEGTYSDTLTFTIAAN